MKRISLFTLLCLIAIPVLAEQVSVVTFNPSRLGEYQHLKVTDSATLRGGLSTPRFEVGAGAAVLLDNQTTDKQVLFGDIVGGQGNPGNRGEMTINMPQALFRKDGDIFQASYIASQDYNPNANLWLPQIYAVGGRMEFTNDSFVNVFLLPSNQEDRTTALEATFLQSNQLDVANDVFIIGDDNNESVYGLNSDGTTFLLDPVFQLGWYQIPNERTVQDRIGDNKRTYILSDTEYSDCNLQWISRNTSWEGENGDSVQAVHVLGLNCPTMCRGGETTEEISCPTGKIGTCTQTTTVTCEDGIPTTVVTDDCSTVCQDPSPSCRYEPQEFERSVYKSHWLHFITALWGDLDELIEETRCGQVGIKPFFTDDLQNFNVSGHVFPWRYVTPRHYPQCVPGNQEGKLAYEGDLKLAWKWAIFAPVAFQCKARDRMKVYKCVCRY